VKELSDQTRGMIFVVLVVAVTFIWLHFFQPPTPPPGSQKSAATSTQQTSLQSGGQAGGQTGAQASAAPVGTAVSAASPVPAIAAVQASAEKTIDVDGPLYHVQISNRGGVVRSWKLKKYLDDQTPAHPLELVNQDASQQLGWPFALLLSDAQLQERANSGLYEVTPADGAFTAPATITLHWSDGHLDVTKKLMFDADYQLSAEVSATLDGRLLEPALAWRGGFGDRAVYKAAQLVTVFYKQSDKLNLLQYKKLGVSGNQSQPVTQAGPLQFAGIEDQFFAATFIPAGSDISLWHWTQDHAANGSSEPEAEMAVGPTSSGPLRLRLYVGPKDLVLLGKVQPSLEELVQFGWFGVISKPLLLVLQWVHRYVPNWGWAIVVFTIALTMVLLPIRIWTFRSARKMQLLAPEIKTIQDRYKKYSMNDPRKRKMNEEVMAVYQREGVNPVGSCLPMLVQLPILIAFYRMLQGSIELRHAPWIGWVHDLSAKDPYYILPVAMVITSYLMTKMTPMPTATDPTQQKMMLLMPVFMGFIFFNLSSGLNLYYFTSNLGNVAQQWYLNRTHPLPSRSKFKKKQE
jgi:YidC/Oxa1 family membrane protein insertase